MTKKIKQLLSLILSFYLIFVPALNAAGIEVDGTTSTSLDNAQNGVTIVNIANPNSQGLSHNKYKQFNVAKKGLILNNSMDTTVKTQLGGYIFGNRQLTSNAKVILNEVTSTSRTQLNGYTEVAGKRADLVIANPNGITVNGAGFINTANVTLSAGKPNILNGSISSYEIQSGDIAIEGDGLDTIQTDSAYLYSKVLKLNAKIYANNLNVKFGSLDASTLGGMYANSIMLQGTDKGVGVNLPPEVLASDGDILITANGDIKLNKLSASNDIQVSSSQNIEVNDQITSANNINISATDITNNSLINSANDIAFNATTFTNNKTIFSGNDIAMHITNNLKNTKGSNIFAVNNILIDGGTTTSKTKSVDNIMANIQSINGDISIYARQLNNIGEATLDYEIWYKDLFKGTTSMDYADLIWLDIAYHTVGWYENSPFGALNEWRSHIASIMRSKLPGMDKSVYSNKSYFDFSAIEKYYISKSKMNFAKIQSKNNVNLFIDNGLNKDAYIYAGKDLNLDVKETLKVTATNEEVKSSGYLYIVQAVGITWSCDCDWKGSCDTCWAFSTNRGYRKKSDKLTVYADSLVSAGENVVLTDGLLEVDGSTDANVITMLNEVDDTLSQTPSALDYKLPIDDNGLFVLAKDPSSRYLIETNPQFSNLNNFLSSQYLLDRLGYDAEREAKILGDGLYEQRLVRDQILQQTGKTFLDPQYTTNQDIYQNLLDNAFQAQQDLELSVGVSLSKAQINALTQDIVWMEEKEVLGTKVLVPVLYLADNKHYKIAGGSIVAGDELALQVKQLSNSGNLHADSKISIQSDTVTNKKDIKTDGTVAIIAKNDINNLSGTIKGKNTYIESLQGNINNETLSKNKSYKTGIYNIKKTESAKTATILATNGDVNLKAKGDISNKASEIKAKNGDVVVTTTDGDINFKAIRKDTSVNALFDGGFYKSQQVNFKTSSIDGNNVVLKSAKDVNLEATKVNTTQNITIDAGHNTNITALKTLNSTDSQYTNSTSGITKKTTVETMKTQNETIVSSELKGTNITINTGDTTTVQASSLQAKEDLNIQSDKLNIFAAKKADYTESHSSGKGFLSANTSTDIQLKENVHQTAIKANDVNIKTANDINMESVAIDAKNSVTLHTQKGNVNLTAKAYTNAEYHESSSSSFGGLVGSHSIDSLSKTQLGSASTAAQNSINVGGENINIVANDLEAKNGTIKLQAEKNINIASAKESSSEQHVRESTGINLSLDGGKLTYAEVTKDSNAKKNTTNKASNITANKLILESKSDTNIIASNVNANEMEVNTLKDFNVVAAQDIHINNEEHSKKELGVELKLTTKEASWFEGYWEDTKGTTITQKDVAKATLNIGKLNIQSKNTNIIGSDITANDVVINAKNTTVLAATASTDKQQYSKSVKSGVSVGVTQNITDTIDKMKNIGDAQGATGTASRTLKAYDALNSFLQKPVDAGVYVIYEESKTSTNEHSQQAVASNIYALNNAAMHADKNLEVGGSNIYANNNLKLNANNINLHASTQKYSTDTATRATNAKASIYGSDMGTVTLGFQKNANDTKGITYANSHITAGNTATLQSEQDTTLKGAVVEANELEVNVGRNLFMQSMQDTQSMHGSSKGGSISGNVLTMTPTGASANYGTNKAERAWVDEVSTLNGKKSIVVSVNDTTTLKGASITNIGANGEDKGKLRFTTKKLKTQDLHDYDNYKNTNTGMSIGSVDSNPSLNSIDFAYNTKNKEQIVRATVGKGVVTTDSDTRSLNRDITKTKEITKDESSNIELYASDSSVKALSDPTRTYEELKQKAKDVGLAAYSEVLNNIPTAKKKSTNIIDDTIGTLLDGTSFLGILPSRENGGGYITQIATQLFGDNRTGIIVKDKTTLLKAGVKEEDIQEVTLVKTQDGVKEFTEKIKEDEILDRVTVYRTDPNKTVVIGDADIKTGNPALESYKIRLSEEDVKNSGISHLFTNGMFNSTQTAVYNQQTQQGYADGVLNYNQQHGIVGDIIEDIQDHISANTGLSIFATGGARQTGEIITQMTDIRKGDLTVSAHSQGTMMTQNGMMQNIEKLSNIVQSNQKSKFLVQFSGGPVNHKITEETIATIYGGEDVLKVRTSGKGIDSIFRSHVTPQDAVGTVLGMQSAGINNSDNLGANIAKSIVASPRLFGVGETSPHSYYPCVIGCGDENLIPKKDFYIDYKKKDTKVERPLEEYYKTNFRNNEGKVTIDVDLLPTAQKSTTLKVEQ